VVGRGGEEGGGEGVGYASLPGLHPSVGGPAGGVRSIHSFVLHSVGSLRATVLVQGTCTPTVQVPRTVQYQSVPVSICCEL
jgi:hypothetical protein